MLLAPQIDVIVPVRGAGPVFRRCADSLARHVDPERHRLVIILDGPPDAETVAAVDALKAARLDLAIVEHPEPRGFVVSVNAGVSLSDRDVVLLNSDTQVTSRWLDKLHAAAYADPWTATATPFSNNASICSLPTFLAENTLPAGYDLDAFAALIERVAAREYPRLPTGVGACLYIKRRVLDEIGAFSDDFGFGYGEETDFCLRASAHGYHHVLDEATFIFHEGSRSFGTSRKRRVRRAHRLIRSRHPRYWPQVAEFIRRDPIAPARGRVITALRASRPKTSTPRASERVLHVVHGWPPWAHGGTELYAYWLAHQQARQHAVAVYARIADPDRLLGDAVEHLDRDIRVRLIVNNFVQRDPFSRNGFHCAPIARDFARYLDEVRPTLVHVHHLAGHGASLIATIKRRGIPILYQAQDWWPICARVNLVDRGGALCSGPEPFKCARCLPMTNLPPATIASATLHRLRRKWIGAQLARVDAVVMGSQFIADSYRQWQVLPPELPVHVLPYGVPVHGRRDATPGTMRDATPGSPLRFGYIGALLPHKGVHVCVDAFRGIDSRQAELHVWGSSDDGGYAAALAERATNAGQAAPVRFHGAFIEADKAAILRSLDVLIVPSIGLESFGLVAREAWEQRVPVIASRLGALTELVTQDQAGALFTPNDPADLVMHIRRLIDDPDLLDRWRRNVPAVKSVEHHAAEIDAIYQTLAKPQRR
jgi:glycosyltransferase involved in cell wall biosynthesis/GT2 family glycosyltransferase